MVKLLLNFGADPNKPNPKGETPLMLVCKKTDKSLVLAKLVKMLAIKGAR
jgi:ankyrin repeat protein